MIKDLLFEIIVPFRCYLICVSYRSTGRLIATGVFRRDAVNRKLVVLLDDAFAFKVDGMSIEFSALLSSNEIGARLETTIVGEKKGDATTSQTSRMLMVEESTTAFMVPC